MYTKPRDTFNVSLFVINSFLISIHIVIQFPPFVNINLKLTRRKYLPKQASYVIYLTCRHIGVDLNWFILNFVFS